MKSIQLWSILLISARMIWSYLTSIIFKIFDWGGSNSGGRAFYSRATPTYLYMCFSEERISKSSGRLIAAVRFGPSVARNAHSLSHARGRWQCVYFTAGCIWPSLSYAADGEL